MAGLWAGWRGFLGQVPSQEDAPRSCPHCAGAPLSVRHLLRDCPAAEAPRAAAWAAIRRALPLHVAAPAMPAALPPPGHPDRDLLVMLALGIPPIGVCGAPPPDSWLPRDDDGDDDGDERPRSESLFKPLFKGFRHARAFARRVRDLALDALPDADWVGRPTSNSLRGAAAVPARA